MIIYTNVCDHCGTQRQIEIPEKKGEIITNNGFEFNFYTQDVATALLAEKKPYNTPKFKSITFCDKECLLSFLKTRLTDDGKLIDR